MAAGYYRTVRTRAKGRWFGRRVADIVPELGPGARAHGDVQRTVGPQDTLEYDVHVHEPPVPDVPRRCVVHAERDFVVVDKPSGIPVHPTVNYVHNSVTERLRAEWGALYPCYRLDRATSGVLVLARTPAFAAHVHTQPAKHKRYYARTQARCVPRDFAAAEFTDAIVTYNAKLGYARFLDAWRQAKPAVTRVRLVARDAAHAVLECEPVTGRTHQIRKHLALHGMPIDGDDVYADAALYARLCADPSPANFAAVWARYEAQRAAKLTGAACAECGAPLYASQPQTLYLHCAEYGVDGRVFRVPPPWMPAPAAGSP